ncbi:Adenosylcobinamide-GDP ribazoletransferase [Candidatus Desulfarcum epimagneticum]|uniref:Adenosylcobinamide-GDP ribazoletransferase n=1 Tax=uncultured Desulfobacteraceae bacterium TaxID=218296 RepID=A0A484HK08_9BACT|nr:Adenosylcobinamide-GDP ribazoletransferase [uncultured Desulfobacteraceae bacterium]
MKGFFSAMRFLTVLPLPAGNPEDFEVGAMIPFFPLAGLVIGGITAVFDAGASFLWGRFVVSILDAALLAALTGALHIDGMGDTADGLFSRRSKERSLEIMKDSRMGAMGVTAIVLTLSVKWAAIAGMDSCRGLFILIIPALSRGSVLFAFRALDYGRTGGLGHDFFNPKLRLSSFGGLAVPAALAFFAGPAAAAILLSAFVLLTAAIIIYYQKRMGRATGDMMGAMIEASETGLFLAAAALA